jgi:hypothetical protein
MVSPRGEHSVKTLLLMPTPCEKLRALPMSVPEISCSKSVPVLAR